MRYTLMFCFGERAKAVDVNTSILQCFYVMA